MLGAGVLDGQLPPASPTPQDARQQCRPLLRRAAAAGCRGVVTSHFPDRLRAVPVDITFVRPGFERQPFRARPAPRARLGARAIVLDRHAGAAIGVGAAIGRVVDERAQRRIMRAAPRDGTAVHPRRQFELMLEEPLTGLGARCPTRRSCRSRAGSPPARGDRGPSQPTLDLHEAHRRGNEELAPPRLLVSRADRDRCRRRSSSYSFRLPLSPSSSQSLPCRGA